MCLHSAPTLLCLIQFMGQPRIQPFNRFRSQTSQPQDFRFYRSLAQDISADLLADIQDKWAVNLHLWVHMCLANHIHSHANPSFSAAKILATSLDETLFNLYVTLFTCNACLLDPVVRLTDNFRKYRLLTTCRHIHRRGTIDVANLRFSRSL